MHSVKNNIKILCTFATFSLQGWTGQSHHYCGRQTVVPDFKSVGGSVQVNMKTDASSSGSGFRLLYRIAREFWVLLSPVKTRGSRVELVRLSVRPSVRLSVRPSVRPSVCPSVCPA